MKQIPDQNWMSLVWAYPGMPLPPKKTPKLDIFPLQPIALWSNNSTKKKKKAPISHVRTDNVRFWITVKF